MHILDRECTGRKTYLGVATLSCRKTSRADVTDAARAVRWLKRNKHPECFRIPEPEVAKTGVTFDGIIDVFHFLRSVYRNRAV